MARHVRRDAAFAVAAGALIVSAGLVSAQDPPGSATASETRKASGGIAHVEDAAGKRSADGDRKGRAGRKRLTINTAAVWRDYVRVQPSGDDPKGPKVDHSITTKGQPESKDSDVTVLATPRTRIETRLRAADDTATEGRPDPSADRPTAGAVKDLRVGQFVDVEYSRAGRRNRATRIVIVKPSGGPNSPALGPDRAAGAAAEKAQP